MALVSGGSGSRATVRVLPGVGAIMPDVMRRLVERGLPVLDVARVAQDPEMAHAPATLSSLASWSADTGHPADSLRHAGRHRMPERALLWSVFEQRYGHVDDHARLGD